MRSTRRTNKPLASLSGVAKAFPDAWRRQHRLGGLWRALRNQPDPHASWVLRDINVEIPAGESVALVGRNGAGKSTLLKTLVGVLRPTRGKVVNRASTGALLELGAGFHAEYTGRQNLRLSAALMGIGRGELRRLEPAIIEFADIGDHIDEPVKHYSSGMVVRLGFAILSVTRPQLLITDEVLAVGDAAFQAKCLDWIDDYQEGGGTLLMVSHSMDQVRRLCRHAYWIDAGTIRARGPVDDVVDQYLAEVDAQMTATGDGQAGSYRITEMTLNGAESASIEPRGDLSIAATVFSPDGRPPVLALGCKDAHSAAIHGTTSEIDNAQPKQLDEHRFAFQMTYRNLPLKPGKYRINGHALDPEGLRLFDTVVRPFEVRGEDDNSGFYADAETETTDPDLAKDLKTGEL